MNQYAPSVVLISVLSAFMWTQTYGVPLPLSPSQRSRASEAVLIPTGRHASFHGHYNTAASVINQGTAAQNQARKRPHVVSVDGHKSTCLKCEYGYMMCRLRSCLRCPPADAVCKLRCTEACSQVQRSCASLVCNPPPLSHTAPTSSPILTKVTPGPKGKDALVDPEMTVEPLSGIHSAVDAPKFSSNATKATSISRHFDDLRADPRYTNEFPFLRDAVRLAFCRFKGASRCGELRAPVVFSLTRKLHLKPIGTSSETHAFASFLIQTSSTLFRKVCGLWDV